MTRHRHWVAAKSPLQHHRQHDLAATSCHGQCHLDSTITSITRWCHRQHDLAATSCHGQCHLDSTITSITRWCHRQHDSTSTSRNGLIIDINKWHMFSMARRHIVSSYQYHSLIYLVPRSMQASCCAARHLCDASTFWRFTLWRL
jgi:hypothetical protein